MREEPQTASCCTNHNRRRNSRCMSQANQHKLCLDGVVSMASIPTIVVVGTNADKNLAQLSSGHNSSSRGEDATKLQVPDINSEKSIGNRSETSSIDEHARATSVAAQNSSRPYLSHSPRNIKKQNDFDVTDEADLSKSVQDDAASVETVFVVGTPWLLSQILLIGCHFLNTR